MKIKLSINQAERAELQGIKASTKLGEQSPIYRLIEKIEEACVCSETQVQHNDVKTLKNMTWYIAEVSFRSSNPVHRCLAFHRGGGRLELMASYEGIEHVHIDKLAYFRPIQKLAAMHEECTFFLSKDVPTPVIIYIEKH